MLQAIRNPNDILKELETEIKIIDNVLKPIIGDYFINKPVMFINLFSYTLNIFKNFNLIFFSFFKLLH